MAVVRGVGRCNRELRGFQGHDRVVLRIEDLDHPRDKSGAAAQAVEDLRWLGFNWDEEYVQSERREFYRAALRRLVDAGLAYPCVCSRRDVEAAQSAPHDGEQLRYPGTCRGRFATWEEAERAKGAAPCWRFATPPGSVVEFDDAFAGRFRQDVAEALGLEAVDFPQETAIGALGLYVSGGSVGDFQPMNINFGIIQELGYRVKGKRNKNAAISERALQILSDMQRDKEVLKL